MTMADIIQTPRGMFMTCTHWKPSTWDVIPFLMQILFPVEYFHYCRVSQLSSLSILKENMIELPHVSHLYIPCPIPYNKV